MNEYESEAARYLEEYKAVDVSAVTTAVHEALRAKLRTKDGRSDLVAMMLAQIAREEALRGHLTNVEADCYSDSIANNKTAIRKAATLMVVTL